MKVALIGAGNMGAAFARSILAKKIINPESLLIIEKDPNRCAELTTELSCYVSTLLNPNISSASVIVLAVKPQDFESTAKQITPLLKPEQVVLSFMAGVTLARLSVLLGGHGMLVRSMPNLPFSIGEGMTVYITSPGLADEKRSDAEILLNACGESLRVFEEGLLDSATAVSATGPGYVFYFIEHFIQAAVEQGFSREESERLVARTMSGSVHLWEKSPKSAEELRAMVTSKNGTTAAAVEVFEKNGLGKIFRDGIHRACARSKELCSGQ